MTHPYNHHMVHRAEHELLRPDEHQHHAADVEGIPKHPMRGFAAYVAVAVAVVVVPVIALTVVSQTGAGSLAF
jgi:hypothetical protein